MIPMRVREMTSCSEHHQDIIVLEDLVRCRTLAIGVDPDEGRRLAREIRRGGDDGHPIYDIYDFLDSILGMCAVTPTRVILKTAAGGGLEAAVSFDRTEGSVDLSCYLADALVVAQRAKLPIYVSPDVFSDTEPSSLPAPPETDGHDELAQWLGRIKPSDFSSSTPGDSAPTPS